MPKGAFRASDREWTEVRLTRLRAEERPSQGSWQNGVCTSKGEAITMGSAFNVFGRVVSTLFGVVIILLGIVWMLQAFDMAFNTPMVPGGPVSFMVNNHQWAVYGAVAVVIGVAQVAWSNSRPTPLPR